MGRLEAACFNAASALRAASAGVHRLELCCNRASGGITPPLVLLKDLRSQIPSNIPINVMIRPRGGTFIYTEAEIEVMVSSMDAMKPYCDGFVFGILNADNTVNVEGCTKLVKFAEPLPCTFHRAFDETPDVLNALEDVILCGFKTVLTSGRPGNAIDNIEVIRQLLYATGRIPLPVAPSIALARLLGLASARKFVIMTGGGLRSRDIATLQRHDVKPDWYHTSAIVDDGELADEEEMIACRTQAEKGL